MTLKEAQQVTLGYLKGQLSLMEVSFEDGENIIEFEANRPQAVKTYMNTLFGSDTAKVTKYGVKGEFLHLISDEYLIYLLMKFIYNTDTGVCVFVPVFFLRRESTGLYERFVEWNDAVKSAITEFLLAS